MKKALYPSTCILTSASYLMRRASAPSGIPRFSCVMNMKRQSGNWFLSAQYSRHENRSRYGSESMMMTEGALLAARRSWSSGICSRLSSMMFVPASCMCTLLHAVCRESESPCSSELYATRRNVARYLARRSVNVVFPEPDPP